MCPLISENDSDEQQDQDYFNQHSTEHHLQENQYHAIAKDLWKQLKRVSIPDGNKKNDNNWKAVVMACVDKAPATS